MELSVSSIRKSIFVSLISLSLSLLLPYQLTAGVLVFFFLPSSFKHPDFTEITPSHSYRCCQTVCSAAVSCHFSANYATPPRPRRPSCSSYPVRRLYSSAVFFTTSSNMTESRWSLSANYLYILLLCTLE